MNAALGSYWSSVGDLGHDVGVEGEGVRWVGMMGVRRAWAPTGVGADGRTQVGVEDVGADRVQRMCY
jgi:hypothetical protein